MTFYYRKSCAIAAIFVNNSCHLTRFFHAQKGNTASFSDQARKKLARPNLFDRAERIFTGRPSCAGRRLFQSDARRNPAFPRGAHSRCCGARRHGGAHGRPRWHGGRFDHSGAPNRGDRRGDNCRARRAACRRGLRCASFRASRAERACPRGRGERGRAARRDAAGEPARADSDRWSRRCARRPV